MSFLHKIKSRFNATRYHYGGQRINRKIVVIESDDWGTIRSTKKAIHALRRQNVEINNNPFNRFDILENASDFSALYEVLGNYKDKNNRPPIITANTIVANPDFEKIKKDNFQKYHFETFTDTYRKYWSVNDTFQEFSEGIKNNMLQPQFHGREHVNVAQWLKGLQSNESKIQKAFEQRVFGIDFHSTYSKRDNFMATYDFDSEENLEQIHHGIREGLEIFRKIFGMESASTIAPAAVWHPKTEKVFGSENVKYLQGYIIQNIPQPLAKTFEKSYHFQGEKNKQLQKYIVRNCYFEPSTNSKIDWVDKCLSQISKAFLFRQPAVITAHRINFVGGIEEENRTRNLKSLNRLLNSITSKWPNVEFMSSDELGQVLNQSQTSRN